MSTTSSAQTTQTTTSSSSSPSATSNPTNAPQSSTLYLFTFLATLLLLLAVSCAIVIRSFILRRRFRRRIEEAIAAGVLIPGALDDPGHGMGRRRRDFGEKPKLWEVWLDDDEHPQDNLDEDGSLKGEGRTAWEQIMPVSAMKLASNAPKPIPVPGSDSAASLAALDPQATRHSLLPHFLGRRPFRRQHGHASPSPAQSPPQQNSSEPQLATYPPSENRETEEEKLQISVLISMPNPNSRKYYGYEAGVGITLKGKEKGPGTEDGETEGDLPDVVFGVTEVGLRS